jgi:hypothetical protein
VELYGEGARIPVQSKVLMKISDQDDLVRKVEERQFQPGTVLLFGNNANIHTTTIVGVISGHTIIVEQHPANPQVAFKTLDLAMDEWRLGKALTPESASTVDEVFSSPVGIVDPP